MEHPTSFYFWFASLTYDKCLQCNAHYPVCVENVKKPAFPLRLKRACQLVLPQVYIIQLTTSYINTMLQVVLYYMQDHSWETVNEKRGKRTSEHALYEIQYNT